MSYFVLISEALIREPSSTATTKSNLPRCQQQVPDGSSGSASTTKRQIYLDANVDDPCFVCTGESLKTLVKYFTGHGNPKCEFYSEDYQWSWMKSFEAESCLPFGSPMDLR